MVGEGFFEGAVVPAVVSMKVFGDVAYAGMHVVYHWGHAIKDDIADIIQESKCGFRVWVKEGDCGVEDNQERDETGQDGEHLVRDGLGAGEG